MITISGMNIAIHRIVYHLVWTPKRRKAVLTGNIAADCKALIEKKCSEMGWTILELAIQPDHVHLFVQAWPVTSAAEIVKECKGLTSHELRDQISCFETTAFSMDTKLLCRHCWECLRRSHPTLYSGAKGVVMILKTFKYRLYPSKAQQRLLEQTVETCRRWYNACLEERKLAWESEQKNVGKFEQLAKVKDYRLGKSLCRTAS